MQVIKDVEKDILSSRFTREELHVVDNQDINDLIEMNKVVACVLFNRFNVLLGKFLRRDIQYRFKWGLSAELQQPNYETRVSILKNKLYRDGVVIKDEIIEYVAKNIKSNIRELEGAIISLIAQSSFNKMDVTLELASEIVEKFVKSSKREVSIDYIQKVVSEYFQMDVETLQSKTRKRHIVQARQLAMYFAKKFTKASLASIGTQIGKRDHATVLHACKTVDNLSFTDKQFRKYVEDLNKKLSL